jgi:quinohemoprotein ethanol dehydrogenase
MAHVSGRPRWSSLAALGILAAGITAYADKTKRVDDAALVQAAKSGEDWIMHGRDYSETRFSPLKQIDTSNASRLGLAWSYENGSQGVLESTPIEVNGVIYGTNTWSVVFAVDARTGKQLWKWDPDVARNPAPIMLTPANRGVTYYDGKLYMGVLDGRLAAIDAQTGKTVWEVQTTNPKEPYSISGAPRVIKGKVFIGNAGADFGVRGYFTAYDAKTGKRAWRFYTVPGDPSKPFENPALAKAAKSWTGEWWKMGGGGTVWDAFAYDPQADLMYVGTGNGGPWNRDVRSPGGGDNLYLSSILAIRPDSGQLVWYYQETPGDSWDYTAVQDIILADLNINGKQRKVLMQAPKNGIFYVLDRVTGELLSAEPYSRINWATGVDMRTGRPIETPLAHYGTKQVMIRPGAGGAHNWHPMSFNPNTGLVYIPGQFGGWPYAADPSYKYEEGKWASANAASGIGAPQAAIPDDPAAGPPVTSAGYLLAWDPVTQKERWRVKYNTTFNGGTVTTAGNLVFHGSADGHFAAFSADKGEKLWEVQLAPGAATPITYALDGKQYVSVISGRGAPVSRPGQAANEAGNTNAAPAKMYTFVLDGKAPLN